VWRTGQAAEQAPDVKAVIARSVEVTDADWNAAPRYDFTETDGGPHGTLTYDVTTIRGTPYSRLIMENGKPLSAEESRKEGQKLERTVAVRNVESPQETARRISKYQRGRDRDHLMMSQMTKAFNFQLVGEETLDGHKVWVLKAMPRAGYRPPSMEAEALTGMNGTLWIDTATYQWVRVEAHVIQPVSIGGFLARVQPGTFFKLDKAPVAPGIWLARHFVMRSKADVLWVFRNRQAADESFSDYHLAGETAKK
jgi:hypothetical protein